MLSMSTLCVLRLCDEMRWQPEGACRAPLRLAICGALVGSGALIGVPDLVQLCLQLEGASAGRRKRIEGASAGRRKLVNLGATWPIVSP